jgi:hypothetical protein
MASNVEVIFRDIDYSITARMENRDDDYNKII